MIRLPKPPFIPFAWRSEAGVTAIEYGLIAALVAVAIIIAVTLVGTNMAAMFTGIAGRLHT